MSNRTAFGREHNFNYMNLKMIPRIIAIICIAVSMSLCDSVQEESSFGANIYSNKHIQISGFSYGNQYGIYYTRGNPLATNMFIGDGNFMASFNALIQIPVFIGTHFVSSPTSKELPFYSIINLINGEIGLRLSKLDVGLANTFNLYFTRSAYHQSGLVLRHTFENHNELSFALFEEDRLNNKTPKLVAQFGYDFGSKSKESDF